MEMFHRLCFSVFTHFHQLIFFVFVSRCESLVDCVTEAYVTLEHHYCCITLVAVENMLIILCAEDLNTGDSTITSANKEYEVSFDIL